MFGLRAENKRLNLKILDLIIAKDEEHGRAERLSRQCSTSAEEVMKLTEKIKSLLPVFKEGSDIRRDVNGDPYEYKKILVDMSLHGEILDLNRKTEQERSAFGLATLSSYHLWHFIHEKWPTTLDGEWHLEFHRTNIFLERISEHSPLILKPLYENYSRKR